MKTIKTFFKLFLIVLTIISFDCHAKVWRVNNTSNYNGSTLFGDNMGGTDSFPVFNYPWQASQFPVVSNGDTLHVEASNYSYGANDIYKKLIIIGSGYFLTENPKTSNYSYNSTINAIAFKPGSEGSQLIGLDVIANTQPGTGKVYIQTNDITIKRCRIEWGVQLECNLNATILQNYFVNGNALYGNTQPNYVPPIDIIFNNNIVRGTLIWSPNGGITQWNITECRNNVFDGPPSQQLLNFLTDSFQDNIVKSFGATANINDSTNANVSNVTCTNQNQFPGTPGLVVEPSVSNIFQSSTSTDGQYQLNPLWAIANPGLNGDRGAFGGPAINRYTLSGLAAIPVIYDATTSGISLPGDLLPVNVKARTIK